MKKRTAKRIRLAAKVLYTDERSIKRLYYAARNERRRGLLSCLIRGKRPAIILTRKPTRRRKPRTKHSKARTRSLR